MGKCIKILKIIFFATLTITSICANADETNVANNILLNMYAQTDNLLINKGEHKVDVDGDTLTVKKEIVFVKNGIRYTIWDLEIDVITSHLRVYFRNNNDISNPVKSGSFEMDEEDGLLFDYHSKDHSISYNLVNPEGNTMVTDEVNVVAKTHIQNISQFMGIWVL